MAKPKLLFLGHALSTGQRAVRSYNVLRLLARDYNVTALCFLQARDLDGRSRRNRIQCGIVPIKDKQVARA